MATGAEDPDCAGIAARYWAHYDGVGDDEAFSLVDDLFASSAPTMRSIDVFRALLDGANDPARLAYLAAGPLTDLIHREDDRIDGVLRELLQDDDRLQRAMSATQIARTELARRFGNRPPDGVHDTPEAAALATWSPAAGAHVLSTEVIDDDHVDVIIDFSSSHPMRCHCRRTTDGWIEAGDIVE